MIRHFHSLQDDVNIASPAFKANPFPYFSKWRDQSPVLRIRLPTREFAWLITRYDDVAMVLKDERFVKDTANAMTRQQEARQPWFRRIFKSLKRNLLNQDAPHHKRLRNLVNKAFTPSLVEQMRDRIQRLADELLDAALRRGRLDLVRDFALPLPVTIIANMLGVPVEDRHQFHRWSSAIMAAGHSTWGLVYAVPNALLMIRYIRRFIRLRRADPQDDLVSALIRAEEEGSTLSDDELLAMIVVLFVAGHETTVNLIGSGTLALLQHPDQLDQLRDDPSLIKSAVEELLRYTSPVETATERYAREDVTIAGVTIPKGEMVLAAIASANRDERQFANPDSLDIGRDPNKHLAFGLGPHFCVGAPLARLEGQIAIHTLLSRFPELRLTGSAQALRWKQGLLLRGLQSLPVATSSKEVALSSI